MSWTDLTAVRPEDISVSPMAIKPEPVGGADPDILKVGDVMLHPRFGRCKVVKAPSFGKVKIRRPSGSFTDLHLKVIRITKIEEKDGDRMIHIQIKPTAPKA